MSSTLVKALGVSFYDGDLAGACKRAAKGGLTTAPSGPGLAQDLMGCAEYRRALEMSDLVLADSGLLCLWKKWVERKPLTRISGLVFLKAISTHLWKGKLPAALPAGTHTLFVRTRDLYGRYFHAKRVIRVR